MSDGSAAATKRNARLGPVAFALFGLVLLVVGGRYVLYDALLSRDGQPVIGTVVEAGSTRSRSGGSVRFIRYRFQDAAGAWRSGKASGYGGVKGETVSLEYSRRFPFIHRVSGAGKTRAYRWRWAIAGGGLFFIVVGIHWFVHTRLRLDLMARLARHGGRTEGRVERLTHEGQIVEYSFQAGAAGRLKGRTLSMPKAATQGLQEGDAVAVFYDRLKPGLSALEIEVQAWSGSGSRPR